MSRKPSTKTSRTPDAEEAILPAPVPDKDGMIRVAGYVMPAPGAHSAKAKAYAKKRHRNECAGLNGSGRRELVRLQNALKKVLKSLKSPLKSSDPATAFPSCQPALTHSSSTTPSSSPSKRAKVDQQIDGRSTAPGVDLQVLRRERLCDYVGSVLDLISGFMSQLDKLADESPAVDVFYRGADPRKANADRYNQRFDEWFAAAIGRQSAEGADGVLRNTYAEDACILALQGLRIGLGFSRIAIWNNLTDAHELSRLTQTRIIGGKNSGPLTADQKTELVTLFERMQESTREDFSEIYEKIHRELEVVHAAGGLFADAKLKRVPDPNAIGRYIAAEYKRQSNDANAKLKEELDNLKEELDLLEELWKSLL